MKRITVFGALSLVGIVFSYPLIGFGQDRSQDQNCGRLKTGDSFNRINEIIDCIETKIGVIQSSKDPISQSKESTVIALPGHPLGLQRNQMIGFMMRLQLCSVHLSKAS